MKTYDRKKFNFANFKFSAKKEVELQMTLSVFPLNGMLINQPLNWVKR
jgi:hypothetical protein